jgi:RHS repeat-associated protein
MAEQGVKRRWTRSLARTAAAVLCLAVAPAAASAANKSSSRPGVISVPTGPGSVAGLGESFSANLNTGSARESIAIEVPPGTAGHAPTLALTYDSGAGNGPLGIGWTLGLSSIQVQTEKGLPRYQGADVLLLDGAELVPMGGGIYRLKNEGRFVRVRRNGDHFEVDAPDGTLLRYGLSPEARVEGTVAGVAVTFSWALERVVDRYGNEIHYLYGKDRGQVYLQEIDYDVRPGAAQNRVVLEYQPRPDPLPDYRARFAVTTGLRLFRLRTYVQEALVRQYDLGYDEANGLSLLASVKATGRDGATAFPPVRFWYSRLDGAGTPVAMDATPEALPGPGDGDDELVDVDGDGCPDLLHAEAGQHWFALNQGGRTFGPRVDMPWSPSVGLSATGVEMGDFDGDGIADLIAKLGTTTPEWHVFPNRGLGRWEPDQVLTSNPPFGPEDPNARVMDVDHDKLSDLVRTTADGFEIWRNRGDGSWEGPFLAPLPPGGESLRFEDPHLRLADMNGDRLLDLVYVLDGSVTYWPSMGWGQFGEPIELQDSPALSPLAEADLQLADVNGDGLADLLWVNVDRVEIWPLLPGDRLGERIRVDGAPYRDPARTVVRLADMNGNGSADVVWSTPTGLPQERLVYLDLVGEVRPNLLVAVENGLGKRVQLRYAASGPLYQAARDVGAPWAHRVPFSVQVLAESRQADGLGHEYATQYGYRDGWYAQATREFRGFAWAEQRSLGEDDDPTLREIHEFDLGEVDEALKGSERSLELRGEDGTLFSRSERTILPRRYALGADGTTAVTGAEVREQRTYVHEGRATPIELREAYEHDAWGNITRDANYGRVIDGDPLAGGDERVTIRTFINDADRWLVGLLATEEVQDGAGHRATAKRLYYDGPDFTGLPLGQAASGALTRVEEWEAGDRWSQSSRSARDEYGLVVATLTPRGTRREIDYDAATHTFPVAERILLDGRTLTFAASYDPGLGRPITFTDSNGAVSRFGYDALGRVTAIAKPGDTLERPTSAYRYELGAPVSRLASETRVRSGESAVRHTYEYYDGLGRNIADTNEAEGGRWVVSERRRFSRRGAVLAEWDPYFTSSADLPAADPSGAPIRYAYDALGRRLSTTYADGTRAETRYEPLARELWDGEDLDPSSPHHGTPTRQEDDGLGHVIRVVERLAGKELATTFAFDAVDHVVGLRNAQGVETHYAFDGLGRSIAVDHPDAGVRLFEYDADGNVTAWHDARGARVDRDYDGGGRILHEKYVEADGSAGGTITYHYDDPSPRLGDGGVSQVGRLTWVEDLAGEEHFQYDERGRMVHDARVIGGREYRTSQGFDAQDHVTRLTYPDGDAIDIEYNERGLVRRIPGFVSAVEWDARGLGVRRTYANGVDATAEYDDHDRVTRIQAKDAGGKALQDLGYAYERTGSLRSITDAVHPAGARSASNLFGYDDLYRLVSAQGPGGAFSYDFDAVGNILQKSDLGVYAYDTLVKPNAVRAVGGRAVQYDENGSVTAYGGRSFTWDARGELRKVATPEATTEYLYDYEGLRTVKRVRTAGGVHETLYLDRFSEVRDGKLWKYVYVGDQRVARIAEAAAQESGKAVMGALSTGTWALAGLGMLAALALACARRLRRLARPAVAMACTALVLAPSFGCGGGGTSTTAEVSRAAQYYLSDHLGSSSVIVDGTGTVVSEVAYDAWGRQREEISEPWTFTGQEWDSEAGLYHFGKRYYDPQLGRFLSTDPVVLDGAHEIGFADPQVLNPYSYARNTPTSLTDRDGRFLHILAGALVGAGVNTAIYLVKAAINGEKVTVRGALAAAASGAVAGAIGAATMGVGLVASGAISSVAGGVVERAINTGSLTKTFDVGAMAMDAASGAVGAAIGAGIAKVAKPVIKAVGGAVNRLGGQAQSAVCQFKKAVLNVGPGCFVAGTRVWLASGESVPIEDIRPGDEVLAPVDPLDPRSPMGAHRVLRAVVREVAAVVDLRIGNDDGSVELLTATLDHPFMVEGSGGRAWKRAGDLEPGAVVIRQSGQALVLSGAIRQGETQVFNLEVEVAHAYLVGVSHVLVHNGTCSAPIHHLATNKNWISTARGGPWSPKFDALFKRAGRSLDDELNKVAVPGHFGPHPEAAHRLVFDRLRSAMGRKQGDALEQAFDAELAALRKEAVTAGSLLNDFLTGKKR